MVGPDRGIGSVDSVWTYIKGIRTIHKVVVLLFVISLVSTVHSQVVEYDHLTMSMSKTTHELCERDHPNNPNEDKSCVHNEISDRSENRSEYIINTSLVFLLFHIIFFPSYIVMYNFGSFIINGYRKKYNFSEMKLYHKIIHSSGVLYTIIVSLLIYAVTDNMLVDRLIPVIHFKKKFANTHDWENGVVDGIEIEGVWVKDIEPSEYFTIHNVGETWGDTHVISSVSIKCQRETMECSHRDVSITDVRGTRFLTMSDWITSSVTSWNDDYITTKRDNDCLVDKFKFDVTGQKGSWTRIPIQVKGCEEREVKRTNYTLWDGLELQSKLRHGESGRLTKVVQSLFGG